MSRPALEQYILDQGEDDWVPLLAIDGQAQILGGTDDLSARSAAVSAAIADLVGDGLVELGTVKQGQGFVPIRVAVPAEHVRRLYESYDPLRWGFELWLNNTPAGDAAASEDDPAPGP